MGHPWIKRKKTFLEFQVGRMLHIANDHQFMKFYNVFVQIKTASLTLTPDFLELTRKVLLSIANFP